MSQHVITPTKVTAWLACPHYLTLEKKVHAGTLKRPSGNRGAYADLLREKGEAHETACLSRLLGQGKRVEKVDQRDDGETFAAWVSRVGDPFERDDWDYLYQMPFIHDGMRGIADFIERIEEPGTGVVRFEPVDAKLARAEAKPGHILQLCFYADAIETMTGSAPEEMQIWLGSGKSERLRVDEFRPYWRRVRQRLFSALDADPSADTAPEPCAFCQFCDFNKMCEQQWRDERSLVLVANIRAPERSALAAADVLTLDQLAEAAAPIDGIRSDRCDWLIRQAGLQRSGEQEATVPFEVLGPPGSSENDDFVVDHHRLPKPDIGDVYIDFEGHPFWTAAEGLFFLFGLLEHRSDGKWHFEAKWAHDKSSERAQAADLIDYLFRRRQQFPEMHIYHYNHTERTTLESLADGQLGAEKQMRELVDTGAFIDLYRVTLNSIQIGEPSYGLKHVEKLTDFQRGHGIDKGAGAVLRYEEYLETNDRGALQAIAQYNEDDVRATHALHTWLNQHRPSGLDWRPSYLENEIKTGEVENRVVALHASGDPAKHFLGDVLGYWLREMRANLAPRLSKLSDPDADLLVDPEVITGLRFIGDIDRTGPRVKVKTAKRFSFPPQELDKLESEGGSVMCSTPERKKITYTYENLDPEAGCIDLVWNKEVQEAGLLPQNVVLDDWVSNKTKSDALLGFADDVIAGRPAHPVTLSILGRQGARFNGSGPRDGLFTERLGDMRAWVTQLDESYVAIQGPPGAGKTYTAAHLIYTLIKSGQRVGITAFGHHAIDNLVDEVLEIFLQSDEAELLHAVRKPPSGKLTPERQRVTLSDANKTCAKPEFNLVAGTTWLFSSRALLDNPVDVLVVDEAGQLALADTLAASLAARNVLLVGDPLQLSQVTQAKHPNGSGASVLDHVLDGELTIPRSRGVFLAETYRMHPDVCAFISEQIYQGRLRSSDSCSRQTTVAGTGLRWLRAEHAGNSTSALEEADLIVAEILRLIGTPWTNQLGEVRPLETRDFMVVAPYNRQRRLIRDSLRRHPQIADVPVGTVDKFQGKQAAVVFFSMTTSSGDLIVRGIEFLFSRNRLNVAVSRARSLAYLACTEDLLNTRAGDVEDMRLISTLNAFVEYAGIATAKSAERAIHS